MDVKGLVKNFTESKEFKAVKMIAETFGVNLVYSEDAEDHKKTSGHLVWCRINAIDAKTGKILFSSMFTNEATEIDEKLILADIISALNYYNPYLEKTQAYEQLVEDTKRQLFAEEVKERAERYYGKRK
ncbi:MAG: hypothetical protein LUD47_07935 [Clostridia bacterium]|nr:hypothetical protein [Clostridia bacterium]